MVERVSCLSKACEKDREGLYHMCTLISAMKLFSTSLMLPSLKKLRPCHHRSRSDSETTMRDAEGKGG